jgi:hypothetical protein
MSAMGVVPLRDAARGALAKAPPPLPGPKAPSALLPSMRVPKGTLPHGDGDDGEDWGALVAKAKALAADEDAHDWDSVIASARSRVADEEREWAETMARAKRIASLAPTLSLVGKRPQRPARPDRKPALAPPVMPVAPGRSGARPTQDDEEAEWQRMRTQAGLRIQQSAPLRAPTHDVFGAFTPASMPAKAAPRVVAWP